MYPQNQDLGRQVTSAGKQMTLAGAPETRVDQKATKNGDWPWLIMVLPWTNMGFTMNNCVFLPWSNWNNAIKYGFAMKRRGFVKHYRG